MIFGGARRMRSRSLRRRIVGGIGSRIILFIIYLLLSGFLTSIGLGGLTPLLTFLGLR